MPFVTEWERRASIDVISLDVVSMEPTRREKSESQVEWEEDVLEP